MPTITTPEHSELEALQARDFHERLRFEQQPAADDFHYTRLLLPVQPDDQAGRQMQERMLAAADIAESTYGIGLTPPEEEIRTSPKPLYVMAGPVDLGNKTAVDYLTCILRGMGSARPDRRINLANYYSLDSEPDGEQVESFDRENGCNTIYADDVVFGRYRGVTTQDLVDNMVCETIRTKYRAVRDTGHEAAYRLAEGKRRSEPTIKKLAQIFSEHRLWHRASTDGAIMIRDGDSVLVSQTQSAKPIIVPKRFSLVSASKPEANEISFAGERLPSSDSPELIRLMENIESDEDMETPQLIVHFHHPALTRSDKFPGHVTDEEIEYGRFESGDKIYGEFKSKQTDWLILKNHGFIWIGNTAEEFEKFIKDITS